MDEGFEKLLITQVRGQLLINWTSSLRELLEIPVEDYSRFHRKIFSILIVELMNDGLKYITIQRDIYQAKGLQYLCKFFSILYDGITTFKNVISNDEYIYLYHLRNCAGHIFPVGYDYVDLEGNIKTQQKTRVQTKVGKQDMTLTELETTLSRVSLMYGCDDREFIKRIYNLSLEYLLPMLRDFDNHQQNRLRND